MLLPLLLVPFPRRFTARFASTERIDSFQWRPCQRLSTAPGYPSQPAIFLGVRATVVVLCRDKYIFHIPKSYCASLGFPNNDIASSFLADAGVPHRCDCCRWPLPMCATDSPIRQYPSHRACARLAYTFIHQRFRLAYSEKEEALPPNAAFCGFLRNPTKD